ncbi:hypothetical protein E2C01_085742 [Portunus trituberculatus]|uniref:Uncharacterized protein n=1 Tax=Portunus trituberculatus TaxID=210409 RepID=A0A5B7JEG5_PORTR|nr:hypothetical protein [Portunus trituberculatus]
MDAFSPVPRPSHAQLPDLEKSPRIANRMGAVNDTHCAGVHYQHHGLTCPNYKAAQVGVRGGGQPRSVLEHKRVFMIVNRLEGSVPSGDAPLRQKSQSSRRPAMTCEKLPTSLHVLHTTPRFHFFHMHRAQNKRFLKCFLPSPP